MLKKSLRVLVIFLTLLNVSNLHARDRILWIESYHSGNPWTDALKKAINNTFSGHDVDIEVFHMDTKRNKSEASIQKAAQNAVEAIHAYKPQVVIASDDDASKHVVMPFFKNSPLPFVFCGVNHSGDRYGYPYRNATGIIEIDPVTKLIYTLSRFHPIDHIGYLAENSTSARLNAKMYQNQTRTSCKEYYVNTFQEWQEKFRSMQNEVDAIIIGNTTAIKFWNKERAIEFVTKETKKPTGCLLEFLTDLSLIGCIKDPAEQGRWAAETALKILSGTPVDSIPIATPNEYKLYVNTKIANASKIQLPRSYINKADFIIK